MKKFKKKNAFTLIEFLVVIFVIGILIVIIPNLDLFVLNAVKKEGVALARAIVEQERIYKADNGQYSTECKEIQNWKPIKMLLIDNKYFRPEKVKNDGTIGYSSDDNIDNFNKVIKEIVISPSCNIGKNNGSTCKLEVEVQASPKSKAAGWHIKAHFIEGTDVKDKKGKNFVTNKIIFEEGKQEDQSINWNEIAF